jgi:hypothetical protein
VHDLPRQGRGAQQDGPGLLRDLRGGAEDHHGERGHQEGPQVQPRAPLQRPHRRLRGALPPRLQVAHQHPRHDPPRHGRQPGRGRRGPRHAAGPTNLPCHGCEASCEPGCRRGKNDAPVAIRNIVAFVHDYGAKTSKWKPGENAGKKEEKRFNCAIGKLKEGEIDSFMLEASPIPRLEPKGGPDALFSLEEAKAEGTRCMHCDCRKADSCALRDYADLYQVKQREYQPDNRNHFKQIRQHGDILYEPEKCIKCGLCIRVTEEKKEKLGLTWINRGFDIGVATPFDAELSSALTTTAAAVVDCCPTAALSYRDHEAEIKAIQIRGTAEVFPVEFRRAAVPPPAKRKPTPNLLVPGGGPVPAAAFAGPEGSKP